jgi:hypothetical protein
MIRIRTTSQLKNSIWFDDSEEWVCLSDLKKEIEKLNNLERLQNEYVVNDQISAYIDALNDVLDLCNSSEQNESLKDTSSGLAPLNKPSVSGEHNTGEGEVHQNGSTSSPVQNPLIGEDETDKQKTTVKAHREGKVIVIDSVSVQKKCTCPLDDIKRFQIDKKYSSCCRCGGAL